MAPGLAKSGDIRIEFGRRMGTGERDPNSELSSKPGSSGRDPPVPPARVLGLSSDCIARGRRARHAVFVLSSPRRKLLVLATLVLLLAACHGGAGSPVPSSLSVTRSPTRSAAPSFDDPIDVAFDPSGGMWIGNYRSST